MMNLKMKDMQEELFVSLMLKKEFSPLNEARVADERRYYKLTPSPCGKFSAICDLLSAYKEAGSFDEAIAVCKEVLENPILKEYQASLYFQMGQLHEAKRDFPGALNYYLQTIRVGSGNSFLLYWAHNNAAFCCLIQQDFVAAEDHCRIALDLDEQYWMKWGRRYCDDRDWHAWKNMGAVMEYTGRYHEAASYYVTSIKLSRGNERAVLYFKRLLERHPELQGWWREPVEDLFTYYKVVI